MTHTHTSMATRLFASPTIRAQTEADAPLDDVLRALLRTYMNPGTQGGLSDTFGAQLNDHLLHPACPARLATVMRYFNDDIQQQGGAVPRAFLRDLHAYLHHRMVRMSPHMSHADVCNYVRNHAPSDAMWHFAFRQTSLFPPQSCRCRRAAMYLCNVCLTPCCRVCLLQAASRPPEQQTTCVHGSCFSPFFYVYCLE